MKSILPKKIALISLLFISVSAIAISGVLTLKKKILPDKSQAAETYPKCQHTTTCPERIGTSPSGLYNNNNTLNQSSITCTGLAMLTGENGNQSLVQLASGFILVGASFNQVQLMIANLPPSKTGS